MTINNNNKTMAKEEYGKEIRCENCDGNNVEVRVWVRANVFPVEIAYHDWEDGYIYCADCRDLHYQKEDEELK